jgi:2-haloacid dehalogenase
MSADDMKIKNKAFVARVHEQPGNACYSYRQISDIGGLAGLVGL